MRVDAYVRLARSWRPVRLAEVMTARAVMFVLLSVTIIEAVVAEEVVPLVLWHGIGEGKKAAISIPKHISHPFLHLIYIGSPS